MQTVGTNSPVVRRGGRVARFIAAGAANTLVSILIYQGALFLMGHLPAYVLAYAVGVVMAYFLYARHVFEAQTSTRGFARFAVFYVVAGAAGSMINTVFIETLGWPARLAIFVTVMVMLPVNYAGSRWCLQSNQNKGHA